MPVEEALQMRYDVEHRVFQYSCRRLVFSMPQCFSAP